MKATKQEIVNSLHHLAHWIDRNDLPGESIVMLNVDGWANIEVHLSPKSFACRTGEPLRDDGHGIAVFDGVNVVTFDKQLAERQGEALEVEAGNRGAGR